MVSGYFFKLPARNVRVAGEPSMLNFLFVAFRDVFYGIKRADLAGTLGWQDVKQRYRRSILGPFWLTISMGVLIGTLGLVFGSIFNIPMVEFLPFLTIGYMLWVYISTVINEGCMAFISADSIIKQLPLPMSLHVFRVVWRNQIILAHNAVIIPLVFLTSLRTIEWISLLAIIGLAINVIILAWVAILAGVTSTRYRDLPQIIASVLQIAFYITPIVWMPSQLINAQRGFLLLEINPFFHMIEVVRAPLLGHAPSLLSWLVVVSLAVFGWLFTLLIYGRYRNRISYWL